MHAVSNPIDVKSIVDNQPVGRLQITLMIFAFLVTMTDSYDILSVAFAAPSIIAEWGIARSDLTAVFTVNVAGLAAGAMLFGMLADRFGNRAMLFTSLLAFGLLTLAKTFTGTVSQLAVVQFAAALPIGGAYPIALSIVAEHSPLKKRASMLVITALGFTLGSAVVGFVSAPLIANFGWRSIFYVGTALPLILAFASLLIIPDSLQRSIRRGMSPQSLRSALAKISPNTVLPGEASFVMPPVQANRATVSALFDHKRGISTIVLWIGCMASFIVYFFLFSWLPVILNANGMSINQSVIGGSLYPAGGLIGGLIFVALSGRYSIFSLTTAFFAVATLGVLLIGYVDKSLLVPTLFVLGIGSIGGIVASAALVSMAYPAEIRSTGTGWALGIGRFGSMIGPILGGWMIGAQLPLQTMCLALAIPSIISAICFFSVGQMKRVG